MSSGMTNCWEFKKCGREAGGSKALELGVCPAYTFTPANGFCGGKNAGRGCAYVAGTFCGGVVQGNASAKEKNCAECEFYRILKKEHGIAQSVMSFSKFTKVGVF